MTVNFTKYPSEHQGVPLLQRRNQVGIGVHDGLSAILASKHAFDFLWVSSFCSSAANGLPDAGLIGAEEMLAAVRVIDRSSDLPIMVDLDSGYGDPAKVGHVVDAMVRGGADALCIEDNPMSKRCSLYDGYERLLATQQEHVDRLQAAREAIDALQSSCGLVARTEALVAGLGVAEALKRASAYADVGADAVFVQSLDATGKEILDFCRAWEGRTPIVLAPTRLPTLSNQDLYAAGATHVIFANQGLRAAHEAMSRVFKELAETGSAVEVNRTISPVAMVASDVGADRLKELDERLAAVK